MAGSSPAESAHETPHAVITDLGSVFAEQVLVNRPS
jgi:hypothetical protein